MSSLVVGNRSLGCGFDQIAVVGYSLYWKTIGISFRWLLIIWHHSFVDYDFGDGVVFVR